MRGPAALTVNVLTLFPEALEAAFSYSILQRARAKGLFVPRLVNPRDFARDAHHTVDDKPYGGGCGMVMKIEPIARALRSLRRQGPTGPVYLLSPAGERFTQPVAETLARTSVFTLICGRYEGVDERVADHVCDGELSIGDFVLSGGEPAAAVIADAVVRLIPGVLGDEDSARQDSFADGLLDYPHFTRPPAYRRWNVPDILFSGHHRRVAEWRRRQQLLRTLARRPDLLAAAPLTSADRAFLEAIQTHPSSAKRSHRRTRSCRPKT